MSDINKFSKKLHFFAISSSDIKRMIYPKQKSTIIECGKKKLWLIKHHHHCKTNNLSKPKKIQKAWRLISKRFLPKPDPQRIFKFFDLNKNSSLTYLEFRSWILLIDRTLTEDEIYHIFNDIDQNRDGFIQYNEFQDYFGKDLLRSQPTIVDLTKLFNEIDTNHSGDITPNELLKFINHQTSIITNEEGQRFLRTMSDNENSNSISLNEFIKTMENSKI